MKIGMAQRIAVRQCIQRTGGPLPSGVRQILGGVDAVRDPLALRRHLQRRDVQINLHLQFDQPLDRREQPARFRLHLLEQRDPFNAFENNPVSAIDLDQFVSRGGRQATEWMTRVVWNSRSISDFAVPG